MTIHTYRMVVSLFSFLIATFNLLPPSSAQTAFTAPDVVTFQRDRLEASVTLESGSSRGARLRLTNLNPAIGAWYLLNVQGTGRTDGTYNLEVPAGHRVQLGLDGGGLRVVLVDQTVLSCPIDSQVLARLQSSKSAYSPVCEWHVVLRARGVQGSASLQEWGANLLRNYAGSFGESIVETVKDLRSDSAVLSAAQQTDETARSSADPSARRPVNAALNGGRRVRLASVPGLGIEVKDAAPFYAGEWYDAVNEDGVYVSAIQAGLVDRSILQSYPDRVNPLDSVEADAMTYLVALDTSRFQVGWGHGSSLPGVGWSTRNQSLPRANPHGPDGFATLDPLATLGQLNPTYLKKLAAVICGGFQRHHSVFRDGPLGRSNDGHFYGFIENGVVMSRLNPKLATLFVDKNGKMGMKTWTEQDAVSVPNLRYARQNGVPLIEWDESQQRGIPGEFVKHWGPGNWSGSAKAERRSQRGAICLAENNGREFLIYAYFSSTNPDGMARVFQAYQCRYAIHLDMNSAQQAYFGLFNRNIQGKLQTENLHKEMAGSNSRITIEGQSVETPRYVGKPDNADFFFVLRK
jgi:hypothetical protein